MRETFTSGSVGRAPGNRCLYPEADGPPGRLFPRAGVGSNSYDKFVSVWCADDQQSALTMAKAGDDPEPLKCPNPIADQYELGREIGVTGTPALVAADGTLIPGYMPPAQLRERLESLQVLAE